MTHMCEVEEMTVCEVNETDTYVWGWETDTYEWGKENNTCGWGTGNETYVWGRGTDTCVWGLGIDICVCKCAWVIVNISVVGQLLGRAIVQHNSRSSVFVEHLEMFCVMWVILQYSFCDEVRTVVSKKC